MSENNNLFIIAPLGTEENHFFLANGLIKESEIPYFLKATSSEEFLVIATKENEFDWFNHFWNHKIEENKIDSFFDETDCQVIFSELLNFNKSALKLFKFNFTMLIKNIFQIDSFILDITNKTTIISRNFKSYNSSKNIINSKWHIKKIPFLNDLYYEQYSRVCYLVLDEEQKESDYYVLKQSFRSPQSILLIEKDVAEISPTSKYRIRLINQTQQHSYYFFQENTIEVVFDFPVYIFANYCDWLDGAEKIFMIHEDNIKPLLKVFESINRKYRYTWIDETNFIDSYKSAKFELMDNSVWYQKCAFGINIRRHDYSQRNSDFGSDNSLYIAFADSQYPKLAQSPPIRIYHHPRGFNYGTKYFVDYDMMETNVYNHFYQNKKFVLANFDKIPYIDRVQRYYEGCIVDSIEKLSAIKVIRLPKFLLEDTFVLTTDLYVDI